MLSPTETSGRAPSTVPLGEKASGNRGLGSGGDLSGGLAPRNRLLVQPNQDRTGNEDRRVGSGDQSNEESERETAYGRTTQNQERRGAAPE